MKTQKCDKMIQTAIEAAKAAGKILMGKRGMLDNVRHKGDKDLVTEVDEECEKKIKEMISEKYPDHGFIGEEEGESNIESDYVWVIDPLDATHNYVFGSPIFAVSIGLAYKKELVAGVVYLPVFDQLFTAEKGKGSFVNGEKLKVSNRKLKDGVVSLSSGDIKRDSENFFRFADNFIKNCFGARMSGCAVYNIISVSTKRFDAMISHTCKIWDVAAGVVIVQEAGGLVTDFEGKPITLDSKSFIATNKITHEEVLELVK